MSTKQAGRPSSTPAHRDLEKELAHVVGWWAEHRERLPPAARIARTIGKAPDTVRGVLNGKVKASIAFLDTLYPALETFGYEAMNQDYKTQQPAAATN